MNDNTVSERVLLVQRGRRLEYFTVGWNAVEGGVAIVAGVFAGSIALVGFGLDSFIEVISGSTLLWRMAVDADAHRRELNEKRALKIVGASFLLLAVYVTYESALALWSRKTPEHSVPGIILACLSLIVMPVLSRAKRKVGSALKSGAMRADAKQTELCAWLSAILLAGLLLNATLGLWWADPVAGLSMVPIIAREGVAGWRGEVCCD